MTLLLSYKPSELSSFLPLWNAPPSWESELHSITGVWIMHAGVTSWQKPNLLDYQFFITSVYTTLWSQIIYFQYFYYITSSTEECQIRVAQISSDYFPIPRGVPKSLLVFSPFFWSKSANWREIPYKGKLKASLQEWSEIKPWSLQQFSSHNTFTHSPSAWTDTIKPTLTGKPSNWRKKGRGLPWLQWSLPNTYIGPNASTKRHPRKENKVAILVMEIRFKFAVSLSCHRMLNATGWNTKLSQLKRQFTNQPSKLTWSTSYCYPAFDAEYTKHWNSMNGNHGGTGLLSSFSGIFKLRLAAFYIF